jgi:hypothetical protein
MKLWTFLEQDDVYRSSENLFEWETCVGSRCDQFHRKSESLIICWISAYDFEVQKGTKKTKFSMPKICIQGKVPIFYISSFIQFKMRNSYFYTSSCELRVNSWDISRPDVLMLIYRRSVDWKDWDDILKVDLYEILWDMDYIWVKYLR